MQESVSFQRVVILLILSFAIFAGFHVEALLHYTKAGKADKLPKVYDVIDWGFTIAFILEFVSRLFWERMNFFCGPQAPWNAFDFLIISADVISRFFGHTRFMLSRIARLPRLARCLGMARLASYINSLRVFLKALRDCVPLIFWNGILVLVLVYLGSLAIAHMLVIELGQAAENAANVNPELDDMLENHSSLTQSMLTLFLLITDGRRWEVVVNPIMHSPFGFVYLFFIPWYFLTRLGMMAGLASALLSFMATSSNRIQRKEQTLRYWSERSPINDFKTLLQDKADKSGFITLHNLEQSLEHPRILKILRKLELDPPAVRTLYQLLDVEKAQHVHIEELIVSMSRSREPVDVITMMYENHRLSSRLLHLSGVLEDRLDRVISHQEESEAKVNLLMTAMAREYNDFPTPAAFTTMRHGT